MLQILLNISLRVYLCKSKMLYINRFLNASPEIQIFRTQQINWINKTITGLKIPKYVIFFILCSPIKSVMHWFIEKILFTINCTFNMNFIYSFLHFS